jgi:hypothetical protein
MRRRNDDVFQHCETPVGQDYIIMAMKKFQMQLPDEITDVVADAALPLPPSLRESVVATVVARLRTCPAIGVGLAHRIAADEQRAILRNGGLFAIGGGKGVGKYSRSLRTKSAPRRMRS